MSLARRSMAAERMDDAALPAEDYAAVLADLGRVNRVTLAARPTLRFLARLLPRGAKAVRILDVGFGDGGMLRAIARWAERSGRAVALTGIDLNPNSAPVARAATPVAMPIAYRTGDYADLAGEGWDIVLSSLVAHHMSRPELVAFLRFMERAAGLGWLVNDLHRHALAHAGFPLLACAMRWHPIVRHDGRLSIARSFRPAEWRSLLDEAGLALDDARIVRRFPFRLCVERTR